MLLHRLDLLLRSTYASKSKRFAAGVQNPNQLRFELLQEVLGEQISMEKIQKTGSDNKKRQKKVQTFRNY